MKRSALLLLITLWSGKGLAATDYLPGQDWSTYRAGPIVYHYTDAGRAWLPRLLEVGPRAYSELAAWTGFTPSGKIHVVIVSDNDFANGSATPLPRNTIRLYPAHPRHPSLLQEYGDWLTLLYVHEMLHIFHLDTHRMPTTLFRKIFGRQIVPGIDTSRGEIPLYLGFPNAFLPDTLIEGFAVWAEGELGGGIGRANSPLSLSLRRNFARTRDLPSLGASSGLRREFPGGNAPRVFGGAFHAYLAEQLEHNWRDMYLLNARGLFPFFWGVPAWIEFGTRVDLLWEDWRLRERMYTQKFDVELGARNAGQRMAGPYLNARGLATDADGNLWVSVADGASHDRILRIPRQGQPETVGRRYGGAGFAVAADGTLWFDDFRRLKDTATVSAIYRRRPGAHRAERVVDTHAFEPDVRGAQLVWVAREDARYCLVLSDLEGAAVQERYCAPEHQALHHPRLSPDGRQVAFVQWRPGSRHDLFVWHPSSGAVTGLVDSVADESQPQWHPMGRDIYFISTQTGAPELFSISASGGDLRQQTRTPTGVWDFALAPGDMLYYLAPEYKGWRIFATSLDQPALAGDEIVPASDSRVQQTSEIAAVPDPVTRPDESYRAARTLWPTGWTPIIRLDLVFGESGVCGGGRRNCGGGLSVSSQDVLQQWSWGLSFLVDGDGDPEAVYAATHDRGRWRISGQGRIEPRLKVVQQTRTDYTLFSVEQTVLEQHYRLRHELSTARIFRTMRMSNMARLHVAEEHLLEATRPLVEFGGMLVHDSRERYSWSLVPGNGVYGKLLAAADHRVDQDYADGRIELILGSGGFLVGRNQWQFQVAGGWDLHDRGRSFTLGGPGSGIADERSFHGRGVPTADRVLGATEICPPERICRVQRFAMWEAEALWPLWWVDRGYGSLPFHIDQLHLRTFMAGSHMTRYATQDDVAHGLYAGLELGTSLVFGWNASVGPIVLGARWPLLDPRTAAPQWYLRVGVGFEQFGRFVAVDRPEPTQDRDRLR